MDPLYRPVRPRRTGADEAADTPLFQSSSQARGPAVAPALTPRPLRQSIHSWLLSCGREGGTVHEAATALGLQEDEVRRALSEMLSGGIVRTTETSDGMTRGRLGQAVYAVHRTGRGAY